MSMGKAFILGNITRDVETRTLPNGTTVADFSVAVNEKFKDKEEVSYLDLTAFGKTADAIAKWFSKGRPILVECRIRQERWQDKDGGKRSKVKFIVESFNFVGDKREGGNAQSQGDEQPVGAGVGAEMSEENIPF